MRARLGRFVSSVVVAALMVTLLPQQAFAAGSTPGVGGLVNRVAGWFTDDDEGDDGGPPSGDNRPVAARGKPLAGKAEPAPKRMKELAGRRTPKARFWRMSDGGVQAELAAAPTSYETRGGAGARL